jgi:crossover junction endodeoxyribonuclease RuvC
MGLAHLVFSRRSGGGQRRNSAGKGGSSLIVLGIDPGTAITGFGVISVEGDRLEVIDYGCIRTEAHEGVTQRLRDIHAAVNHLIAVHKPNLLAVEELFFNRNVTTAIAVGQARGVVLLSAALAKCEVVEFTPPQVKQAVAGYGRADKKQVQSMVRAILSLREIPQPDDAADALAVAICAANSQTVNLRAAVPQEAEPVKRRLRGGVKRQ